MPLAAGPHAFVAYLVEPAFEAALEAELGPAGEGGRTPRWPGVITRPQPRVADPMFARQCLPEATVVKAASAEGLAEAVAQATLARVTAADTVAGVFVATPHPQHYRTITAQVEPVAQTLKRGLRSHGVKLTAADPAALQRAWSRGARAVQVLVVGRTSAVVSCATPVTLATGGTNVAPWPAGLAPVANDRTAPSRAYRKLVEAFAWLGRAPRNEERVVDLGGSPGGWAWTALCRGAHVVAVDRAPLLPPAAGHPALTQVIGDAFAYEPERPVDWLLCDVIAAPARSLELIERWATAALCQHMVVTVKFKGQTGNHELVAPIVPRLAALGFAHARVKHLHNNHNEVEVFASRAR